MVCNNLWISIHALREEGDQAAAPEAIQPKEFLSTPSARRATERASRPRCGCPNFYPRPPRGGRLCYLMDGRWTTLISIHALREEGDSGTVANYSKTKAISIHALREEGDLAGLEVTSFERQFLSTPSARRATRSSIVYHFSWSFLSTPSARRATQEKHT